MLGKAARLDRKTATIRMVQNCQRAADEPWSVLAGTPVGTEIGEPRIEHPSHGQSVAVWAVQIPIVRHRMVSREETDPSGLGEMALPVDTLSTAHTPGGRKGAKVGCIANSPGKTM